MVEISVLIEFDVKRAFNFKITVTHHLLCHVTFQIKEGNDFFIWATKPAIVDVSWKAVVSSSLHVDSNQVNGNVGVIQQVVFDLIKLIFSC